MPEATAFVAAELEELFAAVFAARHRTRLRGGFAEPEYLPPGADGWAELRYRADFFRSALHEIAHWCLASRRRRTLADFGYWYAPEGRDAAAQAAFERAEVAPQAIEAAFCRTCGHPFAPSRDDFAGHGDADAFARRIAQCQDAFARDGFPPRARRFIRALAQHYRLNCRMPLRRRAS